MSKPTGAPVSLGGPGLGESLTGRFTLKASGETIPIDVLVPLGPSRLQDLLPVLNDLSDLFASRAAARVRAAGREVSCRKGCGACCRQLVPVSHAEAHALADLVDAMPGRRRKRMRERFATAVATLSQSDLIERLPEVAKRPSLAFGLEYLAAGVACPFLVDESCSIHPHRPTACREYQVTSHPSHCAAPTTQTVETVPLEASPSAALGRANGSEEGWLPLVLALDFATLNSPEARKESAPELLNKVLKLMFEPRPTGGKDRLFDPEGRISHEQPKTKA